MAVSSCWVLLDIENRDMSVLNLQGREAMIKLNVFWLKINVLCNLSIYRYILLDNDPNTKMYSGSLSSTVKITVQDSLLGISRK